MSTFEKAIDYVIENETGGDPNGAYSDDPDDYGGPTKWGVTQAEAERHGFDVRDLTRAQAEGIFRSDYWRFDGVGDQRIGTKLLDMAVNLGLGTTVKLLQQAVGVKADGAFGNVTMNAVNSAGPLLLFDLAHASARRYARIVAKDHTQARFIVDWIGRALKVPA